MARVKVFTNSYGFWSWNITGRADSKESTTSAEHFPTRDAALENAQKVLGDEIDAAHVTVDGLSSNGALPPLPKVDRVAELHAAGFDPPDIGIS